MTKKKNGKLGEEGGSGIREKVCGGMPAITVTGHRGTKLWRPERRRRPGQHGGGGGA